ncbi:MAG: MFS transporter, partial [Proteobacteria bacterium]
MHKRALALTFLSASLPVMMAAMLSPSLPALQLEFAGEAEIQLLSKLVLMTPALAIALSAGVIGFLVDRWGRFPILIMGLLIFGLFGVQGYWAEDVYALIATRFFFGIGVAGIMMTTSTTLASHYEGFTLRRMLGFQAGLMGLWGILFQIAAGYLAEESSWRTPFLLYAVAFPLVFLVILEPSMRTEKNESIPFVKSERKTNQLPLIVCLIVLSGCIMSFFALVPVQGPLFFHALHFSPKRTSFLISMLTASS